MFKLLVFFVLLVLTTFSLCEKETKLATVTKKPFCILCDVNDNNGCEYGYVYKAGKCRKVTRLVSIVPI